MNGLTEEEIERYCERIKSCNSRYEVRRELGDLCRIEKQYSSIGMQITKEVLRSLKEARKNR